MKSNKCGSGNYVCGNFHTDNGKGDCAMTTYPSNTTQGGGHSTGGGSGTSRSSYSSQEQHIQQVCTSLSGNVLGGAYHEGRKNRDKDDGINYQVKGIVSELNYYGFKDPKGIVLSDCALEDKDVYTLHQTLQYYPLNLTVLDLSNNCLGLNSVHTIFYGLRGSQQGDVNHLCKQIKSINLSNNWLGDNSALFISQALEYGNMPNLESLAVPGNQITVAGERFFAQALESVKVTSITIVLTAKNSFKELVNFFKTGFNYYAKEFHIEQIAMDIESQKYLTNCQKVGVNLAEGFLGGVVKCKHIPNKKKAFFCFINEVLDSIVQPETLSCLIDSHKFFERDVSSLTGASSDQNIHHQDCNIF